MRLRIVAPFLALTLAGCAVGPDFKRPEAPAAADYTPTPIAMQEHAVVPGEVPADWWALFQSLPLDRLVTRALENNPDLQAQRAALRAAREMLSAQKGALFSQVQADFAQSRTKSADSLAPTPASGAAIYSLTTASASASYALDVFGGTRRAVESASAQADARRFETEAARLSLIGNVADAAIQEAGLRAQIDATEKLAALEADILDILRRQSALGQIAGLDVVSEEAALAQVRASLPPLRQKFMAQRTALAVLIGQMPTTEIAEHFKLDDLAAPHALPVSVPARLVEQRPDIRAAEASLHAATAQIGVATADMLPKLTLTASAGASATAIDALTMPGSGMWTIAAGITQPIFQAGTLLHKRRAAVALAEQSSAQYRSTVLTAFKNVGDALTAIATDEAALHENAVAEHAAAEALNITRRQLELGQVSGLALLNAERTYQQASISLAQARTAGLSDTVLLFQALGGGWWNENRAG